MNRTAGLMVLCVGLGAAVMYGSSNFRIHVEPITPPTKAHAPPPTSGEEEPAQLPEPVTKPARGAEKARIDRKVRQAAAADDDALTFRLSPGAVKTIGRAPRCAPGSPT